MEHQPHAVPARRESKPSEAEFLSSVVEEARLALEQMGKTFCRYHIPTSTLHLSPVYAEKRDVPEIIPNFPECLEGAPLFGTHPDLRPTLEVFFAAIRRGEVRGTCEAPFMDREGNEYWNRLEFKTVFDVDGRPARALIFMENITGMREQSLENLRLRKNEQLLRNAARHSDRVLCFYDIGACRARPWDAEHCAACRLPRLCEGPFDPAAVRQGDMVAAESVDDFLSMMEGIHSGTPSGGARVRMRSDTGDLRWFDFKYSAVFADDGALEGALVSNRDVTEDCEQENAFHRYQHALEKHAASALLFMECDLTADVVERTGGPLLPAELQPTGGSLTEFNRQFLCAFSGENRLKARDFFSREHLLTAYADGRSRLEGLWRLCPVDGEARWMCSCVELAAAPSGHVRALMRLSELTEEQKARLAVRERAERDGLTKLLNRETAEERIRTALREGQEKGGILILLDLDDLKVINDTYGHAQGDRAIRGIADVLTGHFRSSDIIGRLGGDEFILYLPGAEQNESVISMTMLTLLRKLAGLAVGDNDERRIHCSAGCAVGVPEEDTFDSLYRKADLALYHVKRSGKNNFAFYSPAMHMADYRFRKGREASLSDEKTHDWQALRGLLKAMSDFYPLVVTFNLSTNYFQLLEASEELLSRLSVSDTLEAFRAAASKMLHPEDRKGVESVFSRKSLLAAYGRGEGSVRSFFRCRDGRGGYVWAEAVAIFHTTDRGDVCACILVRRDRERERELELLRLQKVLQVAVASGFEYICLVNTATRRYSLYGTDGRNTHTILEEADFDEATRHIRDTGVPPEYRAAYYEAANLDHVLQVMRGSAGTYTYRYPLMDGVREASFHWYEDGHNEMLMTVRRV